MPDWQLIEEADHKTLRCIELTYRFFGSTIIRILADKAVGADETGNAGSRGVGIGKVFRDGIRHQEAQPLSKALVRAYLQSVVGGVASAIWSEGVIFLIKVAILGKRPKGLVDVSGKGGVRQFNTSSNRLRTTVVCQAGSIHGQFVTKR